MVPSLLDTQIFLSILYFHFTLETLSGESIPMGVTGLGDISCRPAASYPFWNKVKTKGGGGRGRRGRRGEGGGAGGLRPGTWQRGQRGPDAGVWGQPQGQSHELEEPRGDRFIQPA